MRLVGAPAAPSSRRRLGRAAARARRRSTLHARRGCSPAAAADAAPCAAASPPRSSATRVHFGLVLVGRVLVRFGRVLCTRWVGVSQPLAPQSSAHRFISCRRGAAAASFASSSSPPPSPPPSAPPTPAPAQRPSGVSGTDSRGNTIRTSDVQRRNAATADRAAKVRAAGGDPAAGGEFKTKVTDTGSDRLNKALSGIGKWNEETVLEYCGKLIEARLADNVDDAYVILTHLDEAWVDEALGE